MYSPLSNFENVRLISVRACTGYILISKMPSWRTSPFGSQAVLVARGRPPRNSINGHPATKMSIPRSRGKPFRLPIFDFGGSLVCLTLGFTSLYPKAISCRHLASAVLYRLLPGRDIIHLSLAKHARFGHLPYAHGLWRFPFLTHDVR